MYRVVIVGKSLFADALAQMLTNHADIVAIEILGSLPTLETALALIKTEKPDAIIVVGIDQVNTATFGFVLSSYPDLPLICADADVDAVQVITSQRVEARSRDLLAAIAALPKRSKSIG